MITINGRNYRIKRRVDETTAGIRHMTLVVIGKIPASSHEQEVEIGLYDEEFTGVILRPVYDEKVNTTIFWLFVED